MNVIKLQHKCDRQCSRKFGLVVLLISLLGFLSGCGQKGPLYLPEKTVDNFQLNSLPHNK